MPREQLNSLDDYEHHLTTTLERWSPEQRTAFAAAMADRWLAAYIGFSEQEGWGDPDSLQRGVDAVWAHLHGRRLGEGDRSRHLGLVRQSTPHMDDFDAPEALAAAVMVLEAVESCAPDNLGPAVQAALSGFEAIVPDWSLDPSAQRRLWQRGPVRKELEKQLTLLDRIEAIASFDERTVERFRSELTTSGLAGEIPRRKAPAAPAPRTNQDVFEQYRAIVELDNRSRRDWSPPDANPVTVALVSLGEWLGRYKRRHDILTGVYGRLADVQGQQALVRRQQETDLAAQKMPDWDPDSRDMLDLSLANPGLGIDVKSLDAPHGYGPSLRRLWAEAKGNGASDMQAWERIVAWARHRPAVWDEEDRRRKKGRAYSNPALGDHLARAVEWTSTGDPEYPWAAELDGSRWRVRLNDFPDEILYSLMIDETAVGDFHDWPETWLRT